jgi:hypothetical protein
MNKIGIVCIDAVPTVGIQLRVNEIKPFVDKTVLFTQHWTMAPRNYWGIPVVTGMDNLKAWLENEADSGTVLVNYRQRIKDFNPGKYPEPIKGVWHELRADGSTAYAMDNFNGVSTILGKSFLMLAEDFVGKELSESKLQIDGDTVVETGTQDRDGASQEHVPEELPPVVVMMVTHNRTTEACTCLKSLHDNLEYPDIHWVISDDRSQPGHIAKILWYMREIGFDMSRVTIRKTTRTKYGMGAAMNNGLDAAFQFTDFVLRTEDDWYLPKKLNLKKYIYALRRNDVGGILMGYTTQTPVPTGIPGMMRIIGSPSNIFTWVNQVFLVKRQAQELAGRYLENCESRYVEEEACRRFNRATNYAKGRMAILIDADAAPFKLNNGPFFIHIGENSTLQHDYRGIPDDIRTIMSQTEQVLQKSLPVFISVTYIGDPGYFHTIATSLLSVSKNLGQGFLLKANVISIGEYSEKDMDPLYKAADDNCSIQVIRLPQQQYDICRAVDPILTRQFRATHTSGAQGLIPLTARMVLADYIPNHRLVYGKTLCLDGDVIFCGDASELFFTDISSRSAAVVQDAWNVSIPDRARTRYFNAGIQLVNVERFKDRDIARKCLALARATQRAFPYDQDIVNAVYGNDTVELPLRFNCPIDYIGKSLRKNNTFIQRINRLYSAFGANYRILDDFTNECVAYHFCTADKPWKNHGCYCSDVWNYYASQIK